MTDKRSNPAFQQAYRLGQRAFEQGQYRISVQQFEKAKELIPRSSRVGGEVNIWLATAYQALGDNREAIAVLGDLANHPYSEIRQQSQRLLYILQAPALVRPKEWLSEIPDLSTLEEGKERQHAGGSSGKRSQRRPLPEPEIDPREIKRDEGQIIWVAVVATLSIVAGLFLLR